MPNWGKLQYKAQEHILLINPPKEINDLISMRNKKILIDENIKSDFVIVFAVTLKEAKLKFKNAINLLNEKGIIWAAYPKKSSKNYTSELNRDCGWEEFAKMNYEPVRMISLNKDWSALRFKKVDEIKSMKRGFAISKEGKKRIDENNSK